MLRMKFLVTLALLALCVAFTSGVAFAALSWSAADSDLPEEMLPGDEYDAAVTAENTGDASPADDWDTMAADYWLSQVEGPTTSLTLVDRWGSDEDGVALDALLIPTSANETGVIETEDDEATEDIVENQYTFEMTLTAPNLLTLAYDDDISPTEPPSIDTLECGWVMYTEGPAYIPPDKASSDVAIGPFTDVAGDFWAAAQIAQCNRTATESSTFIVQGYGDDTYQPAWVVTRAQMAVFIARAAGYTDDIDIPEAGDPPVPYRWVSFADVPTTYWAFEEIERCVLNGVVQGYADYWDEDAFTPEKDTDAYLPGASVDRGQMAVYIQRAAGIPTAAYTAGFDDVDDTFWAAEEIQGCVDEEIVYGYDDNLYRPWQLVNRAQMAVFVWRGLVRGPATSPLDADVVLGGPGALDPTRHAFVDPGANNATAAYAPGAPTYDGWSEGELEPGAVVYLVLDGVRVGAGNVDFRVYHIEVVDDEDTEVDDFTASQAVSNQTAAAEAAGGNCYYAVTYQLPDTGYTSDEDPGDDEDYTIEITMPNGAVFELGFSITQ